MNCTIYRTIFELKTIGNYLIISGFAPFVRFFIKTIFYNFSVNYFIEKMMQMVREY